MSAAAALRQRLEERLTFGALEARCKELDELAHLAAACGIDLALLTDLDAAIAASCECEAALTAEPGQLAKRQRLSKSKEDLLVDLEGAEPAVACDLAVCIGRYCALHEAHTLALQHFSAALEIQPASAAATLGVVQALMVKMDLRGVLQHLLDFWRLHSKHVSDSDDEGRHLVFLLSHFVAQLEPSPPEDALSLLRAITPFVRSPACSAVGSLFAAWLPKVRVTFLYKWLLCAL